MVQGLGVSSESIICQIGERVQWAAMGPWCVALKLERGSNAKIENDTENAAMGDTGVIGLKVGPRVPH